MVKGLGARVCRLQTAESHAVSIIFPFIGGDQEKEMHCDFHGTNL